jgi:glucokinase
MALRNRCDLLADIGGTHARFALRVAGQIERISILPTEDHASLHEAIEAYLEGAGDNERPRRAAIAVAAPVATDLIELTNLSWSFSIAELRRKMVLDELVVMNDFEALALALPDLDKGGTKRLRAGRRIADAPRVVLGPGTGLGMATLVESAGERISLPGEGGHRDFSPGNAREWAIAQVIAGEQGGHVSCERVVSGPGLTTLYRILCQLEGEPPEELQPWDVVARAGSQVCRFSSEAVKIWSGQLGAIAGDLVLVLGARGGVYLGGGVLAKMGDIFHLEAFLARFVDKGRASSYLRDIPVYHINHSQPGILGVARALALDH